MKIRRSAGEENFVVVVGGFDWICLVDWSVGWLVRIYWLIFVGFDRLVDWVSFMGVWFLID